MTERPSTHAPPAARNDASRPPPWVGWVAAARRGDRAAFARLHCYFGGMVHAVVLAKVPSSEAGDLAQDVFLLMLRNLGALEDVRAFPGWLVQIARTRALRFLRDARRTEPLDAATVATLRDPRDSSDRPDTRRILAALQALPEAYAETLAMRLVEGLTGPEIAERTGLSPGSVRVNLHRGMEKLRAALGVTADGGRDTTGGGDHA